MTLLQIEALCIAVAMLGLFVWDRWRYDVVAVLALLAALLTGVVPAEKAFHGFAHPVIVIIVSVLIISRAIARSGVLDSAMRRLLRSARSPSLQIAALTACVTFLSAFIKNVGTLGIFMPIAIQTARKGGRSPSIYLMPLAFGSLIGGTITLIGTSPNLLISAIREKESGHPFQMFDFAPVGLPLACLAVAFLAVAWRLLPQDRVGGTSDEQKFEVESYMTELRVTDKSPLIGKTVGQLEDLEEGNVVVTAIVREGGHHYIPSRSWNLFEDDILVIHGGSDVVKSLIDKGRLALVGAEEIETVKKELGDMDTVEAVVGPDSALVDATAAELRLRHRYTVNLLAVSRAEQRSIRRLQSYRFEVGDVVLLQGFQKSLPGTLAELGCLPLADRNLGLGRPRNGMISIVILAIALLAMLVHAVPVQVAFFAAAAFIIISQQITLKTAYSAIEGPVVVMLGALIPVGESLKDTGVTDVLAQHLATAAALLPGFLALALILTVSMLVTPVLHHAPAVLVMGPIAAVVAKNLGYNPDPFLMAVALGAACDFLTPIGHQNNLLVMGPGGYRFGDYWRLGLPLSIMVVLVGTPLIMLAWPL
jgi:di/tricarboxylate transporter